MQAPNRKVGAGGLAGALSIVLVWILGQMGYSLPPEVSSGLTTIVTFITSYFVRNANGEL
mgnify:CR=1 FL=1